MTNEMHSTIDLPTVAEIEASTDVLSIRTNAIKVVRVKERFAVKIGYTIPPLEAENMKFVAANSKVFVPKVYANFVDPETQKRYTLWILSLEPTYKNYYHRSHQPRRRRSASGSKRQSKNYEQYYHRTTLET